jgi:hypothetical protein
MRLLQLTLALAITVAVAAPAAAQATQGRVQGVVRDTDGEPIKGAIVKATHPTAVPGELTGTTDERGRFAIIGLAVATEWHFVAEAPGFFAANTDATPRSNQTVPLTFTLPRDPGPIPGALVRDIQEQLAAAKALRDQGQLDEAIAAYQQIQARNARLTAVGLVLGDVLRQRAAQESNATARQALLRRAVASYQEVLKSDAGSARARAALDAATADLQRLTP